MIERVLCRHGGGLLVRNLSERGIRAHAMLAMLSAKVRDHLGRRGRAGGCRAGKCKGDRKHDREGVVMFHIDLRGRELFEGQGRNQQWVLWRVRRLKSRSSKRATSGADGNGNITRVRLCKTGWQARSAGWPKRKAATLDQVLH